MSKVKSGVAPEGTGDIETADANAVAVVQNGAVAVAGVNMGFGTVDLGDDTASGEAGKPLASLHISHNLSEKEPEGCVKGSVWLARKSDVVWSCKVADLGKKFNFVPFAVGHFWREVVEFGSGIIPREFANKASADAAGMITDFQPSGSGKVRNCAPVYKLWVLIEAPEGVKDEGMFFYNLDGKLYAPAEIWVDKYKTYVSLKAILQSAMQIINSKFGTQEINSITLCAHTEMREVKVQANTRKIPYLSFDIAKDENGIVKFTTEQFRKDLTKAMAAGAPVEDAE